MSERSAKVPRMSEELAEENAALKEQLRPLQKLHHQRIVIGFNPLGGPSAQDALNKWHTLPIPEGSNRYGGGIGGVRDTYSNNVVIEREMSSLEAFQVLDAAMAHYNAISPDIIPYITFKLATMDKASFEGGWTARP